MESFADEGVNEISCQCSAQSAKTLTLLAIVAWIIAEDPGPILWVTKDIKEAKKLAKSRLIPLLERCGPVLAKMPKTRTGKTTLEIYFPGAPLIIAGAESPAALQSTPFRYVILDEARSYRPGAVEMVSKRCRSYTHNYKKVLISTPDKEGDVVHRSYLDGDRRRWLVPCPKCGTEAEMNWGDQNTKGGLKWDTNEKTKTKEGRYNFDVLAGTIRYHCWNEDCVHTYHDIYEDRKYISSSGRWEAQNPSAPSNVRSYKWNALLPWWASWKDQVREFLTAKAALGYGDYLPLKDHINETRGEAWSDRLRHAKDEEYLGKRSRKYDPRAVWALEQRRVMTVDVQGKGGRHFVYVIRAWGFGGRSRLLAYGVVWSIEEVRQLEKEWNVSPDNVALDSGTFTSEIYKYIVESGYRWKALKGDDKEAFSSEGTKHLYSVSKADPAIGTKLQGRVRTIPLFIWAKYGILDRLHMFMRGLLGDWQILDEYTEQYGLEVTAMDRRERIDGRGVERTEWYSKRKDDHFGDCEQMQVVVATATGLLSAPTDLPLYPDEEAVIDSPDDIEGELPEEHDDV